MELALTIMIGVGAFIVLGIMFALLRVSSNHDERNDIITEEIIVKATTATINVAPESTDPTQEKEH